MFNLTGTTLGKYEITERLGRGGMADVYKARHARLGTDVAIKVLYSHLVEQEDFLARFEREARAVASLRHPNIVRVFDYEVENELYYIVMDFVDGGTLKEKISAALQQGEYLPYPEVMRIFRQAAEALDYAHQQGMIHRDVKSANILLEEAGGAYLTDFGIAHIVSSTHLTATGSLIGTPIYMSPEQCQGMKPTAASDIYSLGMVLYETITGKVPFADDTPLAVIHKHIYEPIPSPRAARPDISPELEQVILKALEREPQKRFASALDFLSALADAIQVDYEPRTVVVASPAEPEDAGLQTKTDEAIRSQETVADLAPADYLEPPDFDQYTVFEKAEEVQAAEPTVMAEETVEDITVVDVEALPHRAETVTDAEESEADQEHQAATVVSEDIHGPVKLEPQPETPAPPKKKLSSGWRLAIVGAGVVVILLILALVTGVFSGGGANDPELCNSPQDCLNTAWYFKEERDVDGVENALLRMERLIPREELPEHAYMFCEGGEIYLYLEMPRTAKDYFGRCRDISEGHPEQSELFNYAREMFERIE